MFEENRGGLGLGCKEPRKVHRKDSGNKRVAFPCLGCCIWGTNGQGFKIQGPVRILDTDSTWHTFFHTRGTSLKLRTNSYHKIWPNSLPCLTAGFELSLTYYWGAFSHRGGSRPSGSSSVCGLAWQHCRKGDESHSGILREIGGPWDNFAWHLRCHCLTRLDKTENIYHGSKNHVYEVAFLQENKKEESQITHDFSKW